MTPVEIEILMWHYTTPEEFPRDKYGVGFIEDTMAQFCKAGLLFKRDGTGTVDVDAAEHVISARGNAYIEFLLEVPLPVEETVWVLP